MYQDLSVEEKIKLLKELEAQGFEYVFTPVNDEVYGLKEEQAVEMKRKEWEDNIEEFQSFYEEEVTFEEWLSDDLNSDELLLGINAELCALEA